MRWVMGSLMVMGMAGVVWAAEPQTPSAQEKEPPTKVKFVMHRVGNYRSEACAVGDFNGDGKLDIIAGPYLYLAPDWKAVKVREIFSDVNDEGKGYCHDFMNLAVDVDGDGRLDVVSCTWHEKRCTWYRNVGTDGKLWPEAVIEENGNFECGDLVDIDGDGKPLEILPHVQRTVWYDLVKGPDGKQGYVVRLVSEEKLNFGGGVGDINGDGRPDILRPDAWYEAPADPRKGQWKKHPLALGGPDGKIEHTPQILVYDVNADGLNDIVTSSAHRYGIFWYQQVREGDQISWKQHVIDKSWTQAHSLALADLDGDGDLDLVTGKRFFAHNGGDPGAFDPLCVYWYELKREKGQPPQWIRHTISYNQGIGSGMNIPVVDLDGDGDLDLVVTGKWGGPVWFENKLK